MVDSEVDFMLLIGGGFSHLAIFNKTFDLLQKLSSSNVVFMGYHDCPVGIKWRHEL